MITADIKKWVRTELWDQVPVSIGVIDRNYRIVEANKKFAETYGDWRDHPCHAVYKNRAERCQDCAAADTFLDGRVRVREEQGVVQGGYEIHYLVHMVPLVREDGHVPFIIEMSTDITETKKLEKEKLQAERLAVVGQTVAGLAHGVKNVLTGLDGGIYMARTGIQNGDMERMLTGWDMLEENIARISSFVKEFLDFAKGRTPEVRSVDPAAVAEKVVDLFRDAAALANIEIRTELDRNIAPAPLDEAGIHTCLANLVSNALDACEMSENPDGRIVVSLGEDKGTLFFEVTDNGIGIDSEIAKKVFTNFFSTKGSDRGTGLGLLTTRKIVQAHGGRVSFESTDGEGSVFRLEFQRDRLPGLPDEKGGARNTDASTEGGRNEEG